MVCIGSSCLAHTDHFVKHLFMVCRCSSCSAQTDYFVQHFVSGVAQCLYMLRNFQLDFAMSKNVMEVQYPPKLGIIHQIHWHRRRGRQLLLAKVIMPIGRIGIFPIY